MTQAPTLDREIDSLLGLANDPVTFVREILGAKHLYDAQESILRSLAGARRVAVASGNQAGKDWLNARVIIWWLLTRAPAVCIWTGPTQRQVEIVWRECRMAMTQARKPLGGTALEIPHWKLADDQYALGFSTDKPYQIQGHHNANLLAIITEAHGVDDEHYNALLRLGPKLLIVTGNPLTMQGFLHDALHQNRDLWVTHTISCLDTPNVQQKRVVIPGMMTWEDVQDRKREWGEDSPLYRASVLGEWPTSIEDALLSLVEVMAAVKRDPVAPGLPNVLGLDVARGGADKTVLAHRRGLDVKIAWKTNERDTMQTVGRVVAYVADWQVQHPASPIMRIVVDDVGVGGGVVDRLREQGMPVVSFLSNATKTLSHPERYADAATECWCLMADAIRTGGLVLPNDQALIGQLVSRKRRILSDTRLRIESKEGMRPTDLAARSTWRSPDEADAVSMTFWAAPLEAEAGVPGRRVTWGYG